jgi:D-3-phosphoglycerate dehydrogenase
MKILVTEPEFFTDDMLEPLKKVGDVVAKRMSNDELMKEVSDADALIVRVGTQIDGDVLSKAGKLKVIGSVTTGLDHIDIGAASKAGIKVVNPPGYATNAVVEYTVGSIISLLRNIHWANEEVKSGRWERHRFIGAELSGKTIGIIGFGKIGRRLGECAKAFGMKIIYFDPYVSEESVSNLGAKSVDVNTLISTSDVISVHAMLTKETENMISYEQFKIMKRNAVLVNVSRGQIVNESALLDSLEKGLIAGAALDVFTQEPLRSDSPLVSYAKSHGNLILTPHVAGSTKEGIENGAASVISELAKFLGGAQ